MKALSLSFRTTLLFAVAMSCLSLSLSAQQSVTIYADVKASDTINKLANILIEQLSRAGIENVKQLSTKEYRGEGIYFANLRNAAGLTRPATLAKKGPEAFSLSANGQSVRLIGNSDMAVGHAMFTWLQAIGFRYYFAHPDWHIIPTRPVLYKKLEITSQPSFDHRKIWYGYGTGSKKAENDYDFWTLANRLPGSMNAYFGHAYAGIVSRNREAFLKHPEWFYPRPAAGTIPDDPKFDMTHEELIQLIIADTEKEIEKGIKNRTGRDKMISLGPSDGVGTCNTPACQELGSITDRVFYLVNRVAKAIRKKYPQTLIGCLAYSEYIAPPTGKIEPNVFVGLTTAFNASKYSTEELVKEWRNKGAKVGIYTYFSWYAWDFDIPGQSMASQISQLLGEIKKYYRIGVRAYEGESSIGWISKGLGYYLASRLMWDINTNTEVLKKEFFESCFGKSSGVMRMFWEEMETYPYSNVRENDLARWIDYISDAESRERSPAVANRFYQIRSYLYYLYLYRQYQVSKKEADLLTLLTYGNRMLDDGAVSGYPAFFVLGNGSRIPGMAFGANAKWQGNKTKVPSEELQTLLDRARSGLKIFKAVKRFKTTSSLQKLPAQIKRKEDKSRAMGNINSYWYPGEWVIQITKNGAGNYLDLSGGYTAGGGSSRPILITVYPFSSTGDISNLNPLLQFSYTDTKKATQRFSLQKLKAGQYTIIVDDAVKVYQLDFSPSVKYSFVMRPTKMLDVTGGDHFYFLVPPGVTQFNVSKSRLVKLLSPTGRIIQMVNDHRVEDFQIDVAEGEQGLWKVTYLVGKLFMEGVPPYIGISPESMLIPKEVN